MSCVMLSSVVYGQHVAYHSEVAFAAAFKRELGRVPGRPPTLAPRHVDYAACAGRAVNVVGRYDVTGLAQARWGIRGQPLRGNGIQFRSIHLGYPVSIADVSPSMRT
jgi:hypothetical protein